MISKYLIYYHIHQNNYLNAKIPKSGLLLTHLVQMYRFRKYS